MTRSELLAIPRSEAAAAHRTYYAQLVTDATIRHVVRSLGADTLLASTDPHFNDIALHRWDALTRGLPCGAFRDLGDYPTLGGLVCVAKEAAHQWIEAQ